MTSLYITLFVLAVAGTAGYISYQLGKATAAKTQAQGIADEREEDAAISSEPFVDNPVGLMRPPEK